MSDSLQRHLDWHHEDQFLRTGVLSVGPRLYEDLQFLAFRNALDQAMKLYVLGFMAHSLCCHVSQCICRVSMLDQA